jgi:hypothetical protein
VNDTTLHSLEPDPERARAIAERDLILRTTVGSVVHGLSNLLTDDRDELGVCVEPPEYLLGFRRFEHFVYRTQAEGQPSGPGDLDLTVYGRPSTATTPSTPCTPCASATRGSSCWTPGGSRSRWPIPNGARCATSAPAACRSTT